MKKTIALMLMMAACFSTANAQLIVNNNGKLGIGTNTSETLYSQMAINSQGEQDVTTYVNSQDLTGIKINRTGRNTSTVHYGLYAYSQPYGANNYGVYGCSTNSNGSQTTNASFGVAGLASGGRNGYNFGVAGFLSSPYGAGIFGTYTSSLGNFAIDGTYAGFFHGDVYVTGTMNATNVVFLSDYRLKSNIQSVASGCLDKVMNMNIVEFKFKQRQFDSVAETDIPKEKRALWYDEKSAFMKNKHYGLIAQELQEIYPDLVVEGQDGYLGVNYIEIIPILIRSIQELNAKLEHYEQSGNIAYKAQTYTTADVTDINAIMTRLHQNEPNPFTESTVIHIDLAENVDKAYLYVYNMNGDQLAEYPITGHGATEVIIDGGSLSAGMYLYTLIADGQVIDTKRMILTK